MILPDLDAPLSAAMQGLVNHEFLLNPKYRDQQWRAQRRGAHVEILDFERIFIRRMRKLGVPFFAHCVVRTAQEQMEVLENGNSKARPADAPHVHGCAVDIIHSVRAWDLTRAEWSLVGHLGKELAAQNGIKIQWGGDWKFWDPAHWELAEWRKRATEL